MDTLSFASSKRYYRAPVSFGHAASPRQNKQGEPFPGWKLEARTECTGVVFDVDRASAQALLPEGYEIDATVQPTVLFEAMNLRNLPWLNGRGYNTFGVHLNDVICRRATEGPVKGSYMLVLFENFSDPIVTGREELGFPKVWAEITDPHSKHGCLCIEVGWLGHVFLELRIPECSSLPTEDAPALNTRQFGHPSKDGTLHHRYIPAVGRPGEHDTSYAVHLPASDAKPKVLRHAGPPQGSRDSSITFGSSTWEELPTLWNIVDGLKTLEFGSVREASLQEFEGAGDCRSVRRIEW